jgi:hypothetical protein
MINVFLPRIHELYLNLYGKKIREFVANKKITQKEYWQHLQFLLRVQF